MEQQSMASVIWMKRCWTWKNEVVPLVPPKTNLCCLNVNRREGGMLELQRGGE